MFGPKSPIKGVEVRDQAPLGRNFTIGEKRQERYTIHLVQVPFEDRAIVFEIRLPSGFDATGVRQRADAASQANELRVTVACGRRSAKICFAGSTIEEMLTALAESVRGLISAQTTVASVEQVEAFYRGTLEDDVIVPLGALALSIAQELED